ncbi:MAG: HEAT repeat domain-containing protein [Cyanobacteria bacterium P01_H01_bin.15]
MPKQSYGPKSYQRAESLVLALVDFANDEIVGSERELDSLRSQIKVRWQGDRELVVLGKVRHFETLDGLFAPYSSLTAPQIKTALKQLHAFVGILQDHRTAQRGSELWQFSLQLGASRWDRKGIAADLQQRWQGNRVSPSSNPEPTGPSSIVYWQSLCQKVLNQGLSTNPFTFRDGITFDLDEIYVPLRVRERPQRSRQTELEVAEPVDSNDPAYEPAELIKHLQHQPSRVAIIGEAGAGKTTYLQKIAQELLTTDSAIPIWISLGDLCDRTLDAYVLDVWLKRAMRVPIVSPEVITALADQVVQGRVWLLLDAVDEMGASSAVALANIARYLETWLGDAQIVLTSRINIWDSGKNALADFTTYRCLDFREPGIDQTHAFISRWFQADSKLAKQLNARLNQAKFKPIKDLIGQPLYLALLCYVWSITQGQLPNTKAQLFQRFEDALYQWKQEIIEISPVQRRQVTQFLSQLALQGLSHQPACFRFNESLIQQWEPLASVELLPWCLKLGWLNATGIHQQTGEPVYAFYHSAFQDHFAALGFHHWSTFFDRGARHKTPIFSMRWREAILLWFGRSDVANAEKQACLQHLINFQDHCGGFYKDRVFCLAGQALGEFADFPLATEIVEHLVHWRFDHTEPTPNPLAVLAGVSLFRCDRKLAVAALETFLTTTPHSFSRWHAATSLGKTYAPGNEIAIATLESLLHRDPNDSLRIEAARSLRAIDPCHREALRVLADLIYQDASSPATRRKAALRLGQLEPGNSLAVETLEKLLLLTKNTVARSNVLMSLQQLDPAHPAVSELPLKPRPNSGNNRQRKQPQGDQAQAFKYLYQSFKSSNRALSRVRIAAKLLDYQSDHAEALDFLIRQFQFSNEPIILKKARQILQDLPPNLALELIPQLSQSIQANPSKFQYREQFKLLWHWSHIIDHPEFHQAWQSS